jgi:hypothetical protein
MTWVLGSEVQRSGFRKCRIYRVYGCNFVLTTLDGFFCCYLTSEPLNRTTDTYKKSDTATCAGPTALWELGKNQIAGQRKGNAVTLMTFG